MFNVEDRRKFVEFAKNTALANAKILEERARDILEEVEGLIDDVWKYEGEVNNENINFISLS
jgi:hypothetical protein